MNLKKLIPIIISLMLVSCGAASVQKTPAEFDAAVNITACGTLYEAVYEKRTESDTLTFSSPEHMGGLALTLTDGVCTVTMGDISFESESFSAVFDFLPVDGECEKTVGNREYKIFDVRGVE